MTSFDKIMSFESINSIKSAVKELFVETSATRFLILIAVNGKADFNMVSVIFEQMKDGYGNVNAIARYHNIDIDYEYRKMLKLAEREGCISYKTTDMKDSLLKDIYIMEGVKTSKIMHVTRQHVDKDNDLLVFASVATHTSESFTDLEDTTIKLLFDSKITPNINSVLLG